jgi:hypothetical protein
VHDEVVFEIDPKYLQEIVRKLDEWMTIPWKLPKAHGRDWVVPLTTEPSVDISWRAKYNYFEMVDGMMLKPSMLDADGKYKKKLKKDQFVENGRLFQQIPDFLKPWLKVVPMDVLPEHQESEEPKKLEAAPEPTELATSVVPESIVPELPPVTPDTSLEIGIGSPVIVPSDKPEPPHEIINLVKPPIKSEDITKPIEPSNGTVFRWVLHAMPSEYVQRKLSAICILAEGNIPLRIINTKGDVIMNESENICVNPDEFRLLTRMFGI